MNPCISGAAASAARSFQKISEAIVKASAAYVESVAEPMVGGCNEVLEKPTEVYFCRVGCGLVDRSHYCDARYSVLCIPADAVALIKAEQC